MIEFKDMRTAAVTSERTSTTLSHPYRTRTPNNQSQWQQRVDVFSDWLSGLRQVNSVKGLPLFPVCIQSTPSRGLLSSTCRDLTSATVLIGARPQFSASAIGMLSSASLNDRIAYCSNVEICEMKIRKLLNSNLAWVETKGPAENMKNFKHTLLILIVKNVTKKQAMIFPKMCSL